MAHYQGILCENPQVKLETLWTLNPAPSCWQRNGS
jgi:hypothetical protein